MAEDEAPNGAVARMTRAQRMRAQRQAARDTGIPFRLIHSGIDEPVMVRRLDLLEMVQLGAFPSHLQAVVDRIIAAQIGGGSTDRSASDVLMADGALAGVRHIQAMADATCIAGFVDPQLVATEAEITNPHEQFALTELNAKDRMRFWSFCQGEEAASADALKSADAGPSDAG